MFSWKKFELLVSEYSEWSKTSRNTIFSWRPDVCECVSARARVCVCVCVCACSTFKFSNHYTLQTAWDIELKFGTAVKQSRPFYRDDFHDNWFSIWNFMGFWIFWKISHLALTFVELELSSWNCTPIWYVDQGALVLNLAKIDQSVQIFWYFWFFENLL